MTMKRDDSSPQAYRNDVEGAQCETLELIRSIIIEVAGPIDEQIQYGMLDYPGIGNLAAQKNYVSLYVKPAVLDDFRERFPGVDCGKSCMRFRRIEQVDRSALAELIEAVRSH
jgi:uncharacterized protein YdhG (YjbR/CyaY superfamily)